MWESQVWSLGWEDPLENETATHSNILVWKIPWGSKESDTTEWLTLSLFTFYFIDYTKAFDCVYHNKLWKILKEIGIPVHLTCLLRNLYADQEATVRTGYGMTDWFKTGKVIGQSCILSPCLFNLYAKYIMRNARLEEAQAGIKMSESREELKSLLIKVKEESEKLA